MTGVKILAFLSTRHSVLLGSLYSLDSNLQYFSTVCRPGLYSATSLSSSQSFSERLTLSLMGVFIFICTSKSSRHNFLMQFLPNDLKPRNFSSYNQKELPYITLRAKSLRSSILVISCPLSTLIQCNHLGRSKGLCSQGVPINEPLKKEHLITTTRYIFMKPNKRFVCLVFVKTTLTCRLTERNRPPGSEIARLPSAYV